MRVGRAWVPGAVALLGVIVAAGVGVGVWLADTGAPEPGAGDTAMAALRGEGSGFARITGPRPLSFPRDHGAHPDYRSEWWYVTANLRDAAGRAFGVQLTFFRSALAPSMPPRRSALATRQAWMGHLAVTDVAAGGHRFAERFQRGALGLAGARTAPAVEVWLDDWSMRSQQSGRLFPLVLTAGAGEMRVELRLDNARGPVLQGDAGYSVKGDAPGNASRYYSYTRIEARGSVRVAGARHDVHGLAWLDREWGTSTLGPEQTGWDWFALQLDDGRDVMLYRLRRRDGATDRHSAGVVVGPDGVRHRLDADGFRLTPQAYWRSPETGVRYPVRWRLRVPAAGLDVGVRAVVADQEMRTAFRYWEGAVEVAGDDVGGHGYLEMTGYGGGDEHPVR